MLLTNSTSNLLNIFNESTDLIPLGVELYKTRPLWGSKLNIAAFFFAVLTYTHSLVFVSEQR